LLLVAAIAAVLAALVGGTIGAGMLLDRLSMGPTRLEGVTNAGVLRVAVRPDAPQVLVPGGALGGFDIDVGEEVGRRLGVRTQLMVMPADSMLIATDEWDVALPNRAVSATVDEAFTIGQPYYWWPVYVITTDSSPIEALADVEGASVCITAGSAGEAWLEGRAGTLAGIEGAGVPPTGTQTTSLADDEACLSALDARQIDVMVTSSLTDADVVTRSGIRLVRSKPVLWEGRSAVVPRAGSDADPLAASVESALDSMRADGTLAALAGNRFGGANLTTPPRE
jgi:ABC-type amino acid transport substrate-binding protein